MAKSIDEWTVSDLEALIGTEESSNLEFKDGRSLLNEPDKRREIAKDVSAMANAAGGTIVYGLHETNSVASSVAGCPADPGKAEWFEQVANNNIEPKVQGLRIKRIDLPEDKLALVVEIPQATAFAPHQSKPHSQYFRRYNTTIQPMLDHEVRDLMRRSTSPELYVRYLFIPSDDPDLQNLTVYLGNLSREPAMYSHVDLIFEEAAAPIDFVDGWDRSVVWIDAALGRGHAFGRSFLVPNHMPIIAEREETVFQAQVMISEHMLYHWGYDLSAPGFRGGQSLTVHRIGRKVHVSPDVTRSPRQARGV